jgi:predicted SprT family Zn-dependent metalloprotease
MYDAINQKAFGGSLPRIVPKINNRLKRAAAYAKVQLSKDRKTTIGTPTIEISGYYEFNDEELYGIIAHEMIHVWCYVNGIIDEVHGPRFQTKAREVGTKLGITVPKSHDAPKIKPKSKKVAVICWITSDRKMYASFFEPKHPNITKILEMYAVEVMKGSKLQVVETFYLIDNLFYTHKIKISNNFLKPDFFNITNDTDLTREIRNSKKIVRL